MPQRFLLRLGLAALAAVALAACQDRPTQPTGIVEPLVRSDVTIPGCQVGRIGTLAYALLPVSSRNPPFDLRQSLTVVLYFTPTQLKLAQSLALTLAAALADDRILAILRDPVLTPPETKAQAISELVNLLFGCVQLTPPGDISGAYSPGGGAKIIGPSGGDLITRDGSAAIRVPPNAVTSNHLFAISPNSALALAHQCLPGNAAGIPNGTYNQCYDYTVTPAQTAPFAFPVRIVMCTLAEVGADPATPSLAVHERLRIAAPDHTDPTKIRVYDRKPDPFGLNCHNLRVASQAGVGERIFGPSWTRLASIVEKVTEPFAPKPAYAFDGVGADAPLITPHTTIDPVAFQTGFEASDAAWTTSGFWHASSLTRLLEGGVSTPIVNSAYPTYVALGAGDGSNGALPAPFSGSGAMWYGQDATGNYSGGLAPGQPANSGGTSLVANSGRASSPTFSIPNTVNPVWFTFRTWYEIESQNPSSFDLMDVQVEDMATPGTYATITRLNPVADPTTTPRANLPFTSGGFNTVPVWVPMALDLSAYRGKTIRLHLSFATGDMLYNGFRGWIVDQISVKIASELGASYSRGLPAPTQFNATGSSSTVKRVWVP
jgi:hypothetical protein